MFFSKMNFLEIAYGSTAGVLAFAFHAATRMLHRRMTYPSPRAHDNILVAFTQFSPNNSCAFLLGELGPEQGCLDQKLSS